jgi:hypothetical protein
VPLLLLMMMNQTTHIHLDRSWLKPPTAVKVLYTCSSSALCRVDREALALPQQPCQQQRLQACSRTAAAAVFLQQDSSSRCGSLSTAPDKLEVCVFPCQKISWTIEAAAAAAAAAFCLVDQGACGRTDLVAATLAALAAAATSRLSLAVAAEHGPLLRRPSAMQGSWCYRLYVAHVSVTY